MQGGARGNVGVMSLEVIVAILGAFVGGVTVLGTTWRMLAHFDRENRREHKELADAIADVKVAVAQVGTKVDFLLAERRGQT